MIEYYWLQVAVAIVLFAILWLVESFMPFVVNRDQTARNRARNIGIGVFNVVILAGLFAPALVLVGDWVALNNVGLLKMVELPTSVSIMLGILVIDGWMDVYLASRKSPNSFPLAISQCLS